MRLWPRGISKSKVDTWFKELGTPKELIERWKNKRISWEEFRRAYIESLKGKESLIDDLARKAKKSGITLLCSCKDPQRCHRIILMERIEGRAT